MRFIIPLLFITSFSFGQWTPYNVNMEVKGKFQADKNIYFKQGADSGKVWMCIHDSTGLGQWTTFSGGGSIDTSTLPYYHDITQINDTILSFNKLTGLKDTIEFLADGINVNLFNKDSVEKYAWSLTGNTGTTAGTNFIGTTDAQDFVIKTNAVEAIRIDTGGNVGIGTSTPTALLDISDGVSTIAKFDVTTPRIIFNSPFQVRTDGTVKIKDASDNTLISFDNGIRHIESDYDSINLNGILGVGTGNTIIGDNKLTVFGGFFDSVQTTYGHAVGHIGAFNLGLPLEGVYFGNGYTKLQLTYDENLPNKTNWHWSLGSEISKIEGDSTPTSGYAGTGEVRMKFTDGDSYYFDGSSLYSFSGIGTLGNDNSHWAGLYTDGLKFTDGTQGAGKLLVSDANGLASWQTLALTDTATLDFGTIAPNGHQTLTITATGAALSDVVSLGIPNASMSDHASYVAWVSATDTVSVKCFNFDGSSFDPAAGLFTVKVFK